MYGSFKTFNYKSVKVLVGYEATRVNQIFPLGELIYSIDKKALYIGDAETLGGVLPFGDIKAAISEVITPQLIQEMIENVFATNVIDFDGGTF
jgi:hypothetical protein